MSEQEKQSPRANTSDALLHCSDLQGILLGVGLYMIDQMYHIQLNHKSTAQPMKKRRKLSHNSTGSAQDHGQLPHSDYEDEFPQASHKSKVPGKGAPGGTGYAGGMHDDMTWHNTALASQRAKDEALSDLFKKVRVFLPTLSRAGGSCASDFLVHPSALAHLRRRFNRVCSHLLRNDSLSDMTERSLLYLELFEWLEVSLSASCKPPSI